MRSVYKDFVPEATEQKKALFFTVSGYPPLTKLLPEINRWIDTNKIDVMNIETVVIPNLDSEDGSHDTSLSTSGEMSSTWFQIIRVWYQLQDRVPPPLA